MEKPKAKIHFENEPFIARVLGRGDEPIKCTAVVYDEPYNCGVGIFFEDGHGQVWGLACPRNLIASWRATEILRRLDVIENGTLCNAWYTGCRDPHESDVDGHVAPTIAKIGQNAYDAIMAMPVPEQIIRAILDGQKQNNDGIAPSLYPITEEVRAGTVAWRQEFADFGIKHPDEVDAKERERTANIARYEGLLSAFARAEGLSRHCLGMNYVEAALLTLIEKNGERELSPTTMIALAGVVGNLATTEFTLEHIGGKLESRNAFLEDSKAKTLQKVAKWLSSQSSPWWQFWKANLSFDQAHAMLVELLDEYFPRPSKAEASA